MTWTVDITGGAGTGPPGEPVTVSFTTHWTNGEHHRNVHVQWGASGTYSGIAGDGVGPAQPTINADPLIGNGSYDGSATISILQPGRYQIAVDIIDDVFGVIAGTAGPVYIVTGGWTLENIVVTQPSLNQPAVQLDFDATTLDARTNATVSIDWGDGSAVIPIQHLGTPGAGGSDTQHYTFAYTYAPPSLPYHPAIVLHVALDWVEPDPTYPNDDAYPVDFTVRAPVIPAVTASVDSSTIASGADPGLHVHVEDSAGIEIIDLSVGNATYSVYDSRQGPWSTPPTSWDFDSSATSELAGLFDGNGGFGYTVYAIVQGVDGGSFNSDIASFVVVDSPSPPAATGAASTDTTARGGYKHRTNATLTDASQVELHVGGAKAVQAVGAPPAIDPWPTIPAPPPGLTVADAIPLSGASGSRTFDNTAATDTAPTFSADGHVVWFAWTAPQDGTVSFTTSTTPPPRLDTYIGAYHAPTPDAGSEIGTNDDGQLQPGVTTPDGYGTSLLSFPVIAGDQVLVAVDTFAYNVDSEGNPSAGFPRTDCVLAWSMT